MIVKMDKSTGQCLSITRYDTPAVAYVQVTPEWLRGLTKSQVQQIADTAGFGTVNRRQKMIAAFMGEVANLEGKGAD